MLLQLIKLPVIYVYLLSKLSTLIDVIVIFVTLSLDVNPVYGIKVLASLNDDVTPYDCVNINIYVSI